MDSVQSAPRVGWGSWLARVSMAILLFETGSGLAITFAPFSATIEWGLLAHTVLGVATLLPLAWYLARHWQDYRHYRMSNIVLLGYFSLAALVICSASGLVVTLQGLAGVRTTWAWRQVHLVSTFAVLTGTLPHILLTLPLLRRRAAARPAFGFLGWSLALAALGGAVVGTAARAYPGTDYVNRFPDGYSLAYGEDRPFAPSLARTDTGGAFDPRSLAGSESCGTSGCHAQIVAEWQTSAHRYAAMDPLFQGVQSVMAEQNGPESTRYCGGCHDPISLFSGTKNILVEDLTGLHGYNEGVSCLSCHAIRETDLQGNAAYVVTQPPEYLWQWSTDGWRRQVRDFLIRAYPAQHAALSKRMFKAPEYCAACHKQFIDAEVNQVGWVQLQNQYDNWAASHWNVEGDPTRTVECRECHMPLIESQDPAAGDGADYNRDPGDGRHRSHRFLAANTLVPEMLQLEGWEQQVELTHRWLRGEYPVPEISDKWKAGPIVDLALQVPDEVRPGAKLPVRVVFTSRKVGHDFPTGPLDIIQSWLQVRVTDDTGRLVHTSGTRDDKHFIAPGTFMFKAEPVDQDGNLIDRHNLWEMVGVRFRRALFPGYSDVVDFNIDCSAAVVADTGNGEPAPLQVELDAPEEPGSYHIEVSLQYRKVDQFLLNFLLGEDNDITAPVTEIARAEARVQVRAP